MAWLLQPSKGTFLPGLHLKTPWKRIVLLVWRAAASIHLKDALDFRSIAAFGVKIPLTLTFSFDCWIMARRKPLQCGSRVMLKHQHAWRNVVGTIRRSVGNGDFMVHWDEPIEGKTSGRYKRENAPAPTIAPPSTAATQQHRHGLSE